MVTAAWHLVALGDTWATDVMAFAGPRNATAEQARNLVQGMNPGSPKAKAGPYTSELRVSRQGL